MPFPPPDPGFWDQILSIWKGYAVWDLFILTREVGMILLAVICFYHSYKTFGWWKSALFLAGSFIFTGLEENIWIITFHFAGYDAYYFNPELSYFWFGVVPIWVCLGWYFVAYSMVFMAGKLFPNRSIYGRAAVGGLLAMNLDLMVDPIAVRLSWWYWPQPQADTFWVLGIPFTNFVGWFLLICLFAIYWEKITAKEEAWGRKKATAVFIALIPALLGLTLLIIVASVTLASILGLYGINLGDPFFPIWRPP